MTERARASERQHRAREHQSVTERSERHRLRQDAENNRELKSERASQSVTASESVTERSERERNRAKRATQPKARCREQQPGSDDPARRTATATTQSERAREHHRV